MKAEKKKQSTRKTSKRKKRRNSYGADFRLKVVRMVLEEGFPRKQVCEETGVGMSSIMNWISAYRKDGEIALADKRRGRKRAKLPEPVRQKIIELKKKNPESGGRRISDILARVFLLKASPKTVQNKLHEESLLAVSRKKAKKNPQKPRFFERANPNQMRQTDIMSFRLGGQNAYLIGFMDDYSRYIVGMEVYHRQTAENMIEVYHRAIGEVGLPKEMLTDNGRQYTNWRGTTRFEKELKKSKVKHIKSSPHHPQTLGKIERFWKSIYGEFLGRAQFDSFENARERVTKWVQYYNHQRPHQGIGGLCPADRFFEVPSEMKKVMQKGIEDNILEMALRGKPKAPFYMVGRMDGQSMMLHAEKGKLKLAVDGEDYMDENGSRELIYSLSQGEDDGREDGEKTTESKHLLQLGGEVPGSIVGVDGEAHKRRSLSGDGHPVDDSKSVAGEGIGRDASDTGTSGEVIGGSGTESSLAETSGQETAGQSQLVWSMDDTEYGKNSLGDRVSLHNMQDLGSRYKMEPITGTFAKGKEVAENLRKYFVQYGAPLFMKRDWGSNLNHSEVDEVLEEFCVLPLNSPKYYSPL